MPSRFLNNININDSYTLPAADGTADQIISTDGAGQLSFIDQTTLSAGSAEVVEVPVKNLQGSALTKGDPVYISGDVGASGRLEVKLADANNAAKMPAVGLLKQDLGINGEGFAVVTGKLRNLVTSPIDGVTPTANTVIYVKPNGTTGAALTTVKPTGSNLIQNMGKVGRVSTSNDGTFVVSSILRTNDIPNLTPGKIWVGSTANTIESSSITFTEATGAVQLNEYGVGTHTGTVAKNLAVDADGNVIETSGDIIDGLGTANYLPRWTDTDTLSDSRIFDDGIRLSAGTGNDVSSSTTTYTIGDSNDLDGDRSVVIGFSNVTKNLGTPGYSNNTFVIGDRNNTNDSSSGISNNNYVYGFNNIVGGATNYVVGNANTATSRSNYVFGRQNNDNGGTASVLVGSNNTGGSVRGIAIGSNAVSGVGFDNIAIGSNNSALELRSLAIGHSNTAGDVSKSTRNSYAIGTGNNNYGINSTTIGVSNNMPSGTNSHVWGQGNYIEDNNINQAHILGSNNLLGINLASLGKGNNTVTIGLDNFINGNEVYTFGSKLRTAAPSLGAYNNKIMLLGWYNKYSANTGPGPQASIMQFGIGSSEESRENILEFTKDGRIIMDTLQANPSYTDDSAAAAGGVRVGQLYRTGSTIKIRVS